jgi:hypothetical protein
MLLVFRQAIMLYRLIWALLPMVVPVWMILCLWTIVWPYTLCYWVLLLLISRIFSLCCCYGKSSPKFAVWFTWICLIVDLWLAILRINWVKCLLLPSLLSVGWPWYTGTYWYQWCRCVPTLLLVLVTLELWCAFLILYWLIDKSEFLWLTTQFLVCPEICCFGLTLYYTLFVASWPLAAFILFCWYIVLTCNLPVLFLLSALVSVSVTVVGWRLLWLLL